ncbi:esterase, PHB depolymerase family [Actinopolyspora alba]|uniref:Esterase, PHB depolymerase family n=1 Tax=Actinopolyspora alba TaxID=673379 RepID=A0A1I1X682_9ACTN|nr:PHB depolymerase family esterase [Actinopolyspora alba]SFE01213.1 esterase, PHB depolymerase family [Actinopolyspora alba]
MRTTKTKIRFRALATLVAVLSLLAIPFTAKTARAATIEEVINFGSNPGNLRMYRYAPDGLAADRPLVVAMHGCTQNATDYGTRSGWVETAEKHRFALLLPEQSSTNNFNHCFNWFQGADTTRGSGEAESIAQMRRHMLDSVGSDPGKVYATGLSAGGAMTAAMLAAYPEQYEAGGVVAGLPYGCATSLLDAYTCMYPGKNDSPESWGDLVRAASSHSGPWPGLDVWHGDADYTVAVANQRELIEQWANVHGTDAIADSSGSIGGYPYSTYENTAGTTVVRSYTITGMSHGQPVAPSSGCGATASHMLDVGVCAASMMTENWQLAD